MKVKRILIIGSKENFTLEKMYKRAFVNLGHKVTFYHIHDIINSKISNLVERLFSNFIYNKRRKLLFNFIKKTKIDLIIFVKGLYLSKNFLIDIKKLKPKVKIINIFPDNPLDLKSKNISNKNIIDCLEQFDLFCIWSQKILREIKLLKNKTKLLYLPFAHDKYLHFRGKYNFKYKDKINFIGSYDKIRLEILKKLNNKNIFIAGNNWENKIKNHGKHIFGKKLCSIIFSSQASLNLLRVQNLGSHNMRTFEVPAMDGLLLTQRSNEQNKFFPEGKASLMFSNLNELKKKILFIGRNPKKALKIRKNGYRIAQKHTYTNRAKYILKKLYHDL